MNAWIVDAIAEEPRAGNVLVEDGVIRDVNAKKPAGDCEVIDVGGRTLMPGLIDCHVHVVASLMDIAANAQLPAPVAVLRSVLILKGMLERGFTTVRDLGGAPYALAEALEAEAGLVLCGVMAVAPLGMAPAEAFTRLLDSAAAVRAVRPSATVISAGMSGDLEAAVEAGATHLRICTALLGDREPRVR